MADEDAGHGRMRAAELITELPRAVVDKLRDAEPEPPAEQPVNPELVAALVDLGVDPDRAAAAVAQGDVPLALLREVLAEPGRHTIDDLVAQSGVPEEVLRDLRFAIGLPIENDILDDIDLMWAKLVGTLLESFSIESLTRSARARTTAMSQVAAIDLALIRDELVLPMREQGVDDLTVAIALADAVGQLEETVRELHTINYELVLRHMLGSEVTAAAARSLAADVELAVGFVDVVGFTALSARVESRGLDLVLETFEQHVVDVVNRHANVGVVKFLGDAAMLVSTNPVDLSAAMMDLCRETPALADAPLRGGLSCGSVLVREGDYFGNPVNLAARLTDHARPWSVLADGELEDVLAEHWATTRIRSVRLRGFGAHRPVALSGDLWTDPPA